MNVPREAPIRLTPARSVVQREAFRWTYTLRNRERWTGREKALDGQRNDALTLAYELGLTTTTLEALAGADLVEVELPGDADWAVRVMPWEFLLTTATRTLRGKRRLTIVRYLRPRDPPPNAGAPTEWLYIENAAGRLRDHYDFTTERDLFRNSAQDAGRTSTEVIDADASSLRERLVASTALRVVHFAGFDPNQGYRLLGLNPPETADGILVNGGFAVPAPSNEPNRRTRSATRAVVMNADDLAAALTAGGPPLLVSFNLFHSAARTAALCTQAGAHAAIGFQDSFDESLAELFFSTFYRAWRLTGWNAVAAFRYAWTLVLEQDRDLQGSGLVLWSRRSIRELLPGYWKVGDRHLVGEVTEKWRQDIADSKLELSSATARQYLEADIKPLQALNYSLLHNNGALFESFKIQKSTIRVGAVRDVHVTVELHVGTDSFPYRTTVELGPELLQLDLKSSIKMSLASAVSRALREAVRTSLFVEVRWQDTIIKRDTFPITLLPIDEWVDSDESRIWLPSFVLPRDPAIGRVIDRAQRYLMAIADDPSTGFSGYQTIEDDDDAQRDPESRCHGVDAQVRAIWSALLYDLPLAYINPPPVFSDHSQRLRTPSDVIDCGRGTCIDLALLVASCLEYVDIYPVVFLLKDHAFPGYWRDGAYFEAFLKAKGPEPRPAPGAEEPPTNGSRAAQRYSWYLERSNFRELLLEIHSGRLVPLETVSLTEHEGFAKAMDKGRSNLGSRSHFEGMLNIISARWDEKTRVTPLPIIRS